MLQFQTYDLYLRVSHSPLAARQRTLKSEILTHEIGALKDKCSRSVREVGEA